MHSTTTGAPSAHATSRRTLLCAAPAVVAGVVIATPALASTGADLEIIAAWERRKAAYLEYNASPIWMGEGPDPAERPFWAIVDAAEEVIRSTIATTPRGAEIQAWVGLHHSEAFNRKMDDAIIRCDLEAVLADDTDFDWNIRILLAAISSLRSMGA